MRKVLFVFGISGALVLAFFLYRKLYMSPSIPLYGNGVPIPTTKITPVQSVPYTVDIFAAHLSVPWSIVFTSSQRMLVTERPGKIREIVNGVVNGQPLLTFSEVNSVQEEGLMGLEKDPEYEINHFLYATVSYPIDKGYLDKVVRLVDEQTSIRKDITLLDNIPAAQVHAGSRIKFGPDGKLYVTTGDATQKEKAQDISFLGGKILRMNRDGTIPSDNPFPNSYVFSYGHRNPQGITWHPMTKELYETEHGPSTFDGPPGGDEMNHIIKGGNYGWPIVHHEGSKAGMISPLAVYTPAVAPASALIYDGKVFPQFTNNVFFGGLKGTGLYRIILDEKNPDKILSQEKISNISLGRIRDVIEGPDGYIYFSTSNRDGRGTPQDTDDAVYVIRPVKG